MTSVILKGPMYFSFSFLLGLLIVKFLVSSHTSSHTQRSGPEIGTDQLVPYNMLSTSPGIMRRSTPSTLYAVQGSVRKQGPIAYTYNQDSL
jgi:hypothetical protein